ncbi:Sodium- and chloride-dependent glycine transporter 2-like protein [Leptotrombidium deliense]|uniref:Transporter n=1 Tax=Leptotrombidium deliense TaxID=299467 RepID=A0A443SIJ4_9ACAR|nr:Sodium- and chloride-dependent glycine transporter 2-like protein [Leptotrombidium deliense]
MSTERPQTPPLESSAVSSVKEKTKERGQWGSSTEFMLACLGMMVGLGNVWRFPYLVFKNGGGIFVISYVIMLLVVGLPIIAIEAVLGQYSQSGVGEVFLNIAPIFRGIGYCSVCACALITTYYNIILAWTVFYFAESFKQSWSKCDLDYNTENCITIEEAINYTRYAPPNKTDSEIANRTSSADEFFNRYVLNKSDTLELSWPQPGLALALFVSTSFAVVCLIHGVESSGKAVYFTAIFPYVMLTILFFRGITLPGAWTGIEFYLYPGLTNVRISDIFVDAVIQVFYSIGVGQGALFTFSSFNHFHTKLVTKLFIITFGDMFTSIFAGFIVFSMLGFIADLLGKSIQETVTEGTGLAFIVILEGMTQMPLATISIFCFISMLFFLGIDSLFGLMENVNTFIHDSAHHYGYKITNTQATLMFGTVLFIFGLPMTTRGGIYILSLMDSFSASLPILAVAIGDCLIVGYIYGVDNFLNDLKYMTGETLPPMVVLSFKWLICFIVPVILIIIFFHDLITKIIETFSGKISEDSIMYPAWALIAGWVMGMGPVLLILFFALLFLFQSKKNTFYEKYKEGITPTEVYHAPAQYYGSYEAAEEKKKQEQAILAKGGKAKA